MILHFDTFWAATIAYTTLGREGIPCILSDNPIDGSTVDVDEKHAAHGEEVMKQTALQYRVCSRATRDFANVFG